MSDLIFTDLILTILAFIAGVVVGRLYEKVKANDMEDEL